MTFVCTRSPRDFEEAIKKLADTTRFALKQDIGAYIDSYAISSLEGLGLYENFSKEFKLVLYYTDTTDQTFAIYQIHDK